MIASLPMYWRPETAAAWRGLWDEVRAMVPGLPDLTAPEDIPHPWTDHWLRPDLALSMACGLPFRTALRDRVCYLGTFDFGLGGQPGHYHSVVLHRLGPDDPELDAARRLAFNGADSQSGWAVTQAAAPFETAPRFSTFVETGSHAGSVAALAEGQADIAYVDAVSWRLLKVSDPNAAALHVLGHSIATPGLPLIAARGTDPGPLRNALKAVATAPRSADGRAALGGLKGFEVLDEALYFDQPTPEPPPVP